MGSAWAVVIFPRMFAWAPGGLLVGSSVFPHKSVGSAGLRVGSCHLPPVLQGVVFLLKMASSRSHAGWNQNWGQLFLLKPASLPWALAVRKHMWFEA